MRFAIQQNNKAKCERGRVQQKQPQPRFGENQEQIDFFSSGTADHALRQEQIEMVCSIWFWVKAASILVADRQFSQLFDWDSGLNRCKVQNLPLGREHKGEMIAEWLDTFHLDTIRSCSTHDFFFLEYGRCRTVARSLHEDKQSKTKFVQGPKRSRCAGKSQQTKRQSKKPQTRHTKGQGPKQKHPQKRICQWTQRSYHCVTLKNMPKLIIHHDIQWNIEIETLYIPSLA